MTLSAIPEPRAGAAGRPRSFDEDLNHFFCCDENLGLCGTDLTEWSFNEDYEIDCAVCVDLAQAEVPCGAPGCPEGGAV